MAKNDLPFWLTYNPWDRYHTDEYYELLTKIFMNNEISTTVETNGQHAWVFPGV